ncbi:hypothetical protein PYCC9005_000091 [Savitreella phatthalungensis]
MSHAVTQTIKLTDGHTIPAVGLGVYQSRGDECTAAVKSAIDAGYRHIDSALGYRNEALVVEGIKQSGIPRDQVYFTTKLPPGRCGYKPTKEDIQVSIDNIGPLGYIDLYLIHAPFGNREERLGSWKAIEEAIDAGQIRSAGVSNYGIPHLKELLDSNPKHKPVINQIELHPWLQRRELVEFGRKHGVAPEAYSPLTRGQKLDDATLAKVAQAVNRTPGQVLLRWSLQKGFITLPKSVTPSRIIDNFDIFSWELSPEHMQQLDDLEAALVTGWDPTTHPVDT